VTPTILDADPFELPAWVGEQEVTWYADSGARFGHHIRGRVTAVDKPDLACDLLAVDQAYPVQVADSGWRRRAHQAWHNDQVLLMSYDDRVTLAVPGHEFTADLVLAAMFRFSKAVGGRPENFVAALRLGSVGRSAR
jgi:hypothetical protein